MERCKKAMINTAIKILLYIDKLFGGNLAETEKVKFLEKKRKEINYYYDKKYGESLRFTVEQREKIAAVQHEIWSHWMKYLFSVCEYKEIDGVRLTIIPVDKGDRWARQVVTPYDKLTEKEKDSDRDQADKVIEVLK